MKYAVLLLVLGLGACSALNKDADMTDAACHQKALNDPAVKELIAKQAGAYNPNWGELSLDDLKHKIYRECMQAKGLAPKGGVEPVRRNWY